MLIKALMDVGGGVKEWQEFHVANDLARMLIDSGQAVALSPPDPSFVDVDGRRVWIEPIPAALRERAIERLRMRDADRFLSYADNMTGLLLVFRNIEVLKALDVYECALVRAFQMVRVNTYLAGLSPRDVAHLFALADRKRLLLAGTAPPAAGPFTVYRGVGGRGPARQVRGLAWTGSLDRAIAFAERARAFGLADPGVYRVTVPFDCLLAYLADRGEDEYVLRLPAAIRPTRLALTPDAWQEALARVRAEPHV
jgi:hypothetical protein